MALLKALDVGEGEGIDEVDLAGAQGGQTHRVLPFGFADDLVEIGQVIALGICLPVVSKRTMRVSLKRFQETNLNGPVPMGCSEALSKLSGACRLVG